MTNCQNLSDPDLLHGFLITKVSEISFIQRCVMDKKYKLKLKQVQFSSYLVVHFYVKKSNNLQKRKKERALLTSRYSA